MTYDKFWNIVADSRRGFDPDRRDGNMELQAERLERLLSKMPVEEIREFDRIFSRLYFDAYRWDLRGAAYIIEGGCGDDGFAYFLYWLISMGRDVYDAALAGPDSLADVVDRPGVEACAFEEFGSVAETLLEDMGVPEPAEPPPWYRSSALGERWAEEDLPGLFPKLWAKFGAKSRRADP